MPSRLPTLVPWTSRDRGTAPNARPTVILSGDLRRLQIGVEGSLLAFSPFSGAPLSSCEGGDLSRVLSAIVHCQLSTVDSPSPGSPCP
jgi:hypothetical protein